MFKWEITLGAMDAPITQIIKALAWMLDFKVLVGSVLGWRFVNQVFGRPDGGIELRRQLKELQVIVAELKEHLAKAKEELRIKQREFEAATKRLEEEEFARLTLEAQICQLEATVVKLEADLQAAAGNAAREKSRLESKLSAVMDQLRLEQQQAAPNGVEHPVSTATLGEQGTEGPNSQLSEENASLRQQLEAVVQQNADLQERLMSLAFAVPAMESSDVAASSPDPRRPRHRPLAEDEEIQRRIAESSAQVKLFQEEQDADSPLLAAAQRQLAAYQQIKERLSRDSTNQLQQQQGASHPQDGLAKDEESFGSPLHAQDHPLSSGTGSPAASGSPKGVVWSKDGGIEGKVQDQSGKEASRYEVSSS